MTLTASPRPATTVAGSVLTNLSVAELYERALAEGEGTIAAEGSLVVRTGKHTGRSPQDKFIVREPSTATKIWWGDVNHPIALEHTSHARPVDRQRSPARRGVRADDPVFRPSHHRRQHARG